MALLQKAYLGANPLFRDTPFYEDSSLTLVQGAAVNVTTGGTAHTKGSWFQLIASTSANASLLVLRVDGISINATNTAALLDIGIGASGSETVIIPDVAVGGATANITVAVPFQIPSGTRIAARAQSAATTRQFRCDPFLYDDGKYSIAPTSVDVITTDPATSKGIEFSGSSNTWVEAIASTTRAYRGVCLVPSVHDADTSNLTATTLEVGVGSAGNEVAFGTMRLDFLNSESVRGQFPGFSLFGRGSVIPAGSRLAVRHQLTTNPTRHGFCLIGIP
jgi:hypothetical protein